MSLSLNCILVGDSHHINVKVSQTEDTTTLQKLIKKEKAPQLDHIPASDLELWKVNFPIRDLKAQLVQFTSDDVRDSKLPPAKRLSAIFKNGIEEDYIHVIVASPGVSRQFSLFKPPSSDSDSSLPQLCYSR
jgi:Crinkler effector protein N-terminal domain